MTSCSITSLDALRRMFIGYSQRGEDAVLSLSNFLNCVQGRLQSMVGYFSLVALLTICLIGLCHSHYR